MAPTYSRTPVWQCRVVAYKYGIGHRARWQSVASAIAAQPRRRMCQPPQSSLPSSLASSIRSGPPPPTVEHRWCAKTANASALTCFVVEGISELLLLAAGPARQVHLQQLLDNPAFQVMEQTRDSKRAALKLKPKL